MKGVKKLAMRPYHGSMWVCDSPDSFGRAYKRLTKFKGKSISEHGGTMCLVDPGTPNERVYLVYAADYPSLAHEITHALLMVFSVIGHDPREGDGEPFCYMLSQLMIEAKGEF